MADGNVNITVQTEVEPLQNLIDAANNGQISFAALGKGLREIKSDAAVGSQGLVDVIKVQQQFSEQVRTSTGHVSDFTQSVKDARQEHRLYMFAVMEGIRSLDAFGMKNKEVTQTLTGAAEAYFGISFALNAIGGAAAAVAGPVGIAAAGFLALKNLSDSIDSSFKASTESLHNLQVQLGIITPDESIKELNADLEQTKKDLAAIDPNNTSSLSEWQGIKAAIASIFSFSLKPFDEAVQTNINEKQAKILTDTEKLYAAQDKNISQEKSQVQLGTQSLVQLRSMLREYLRHTTELGRQLELANQIVAVQKQIEQNNENARAGFYPDLTVTSEDDAKNKEAIERNKEHVKRMAEDYKAGVEQENKDHEAGVKQRNKQLLEEERNTQRANEDIAEMYAHAGGQVTQGFVQQVFQVVSGVKNIGDAFKAMGQVAGQVLEQVIEQLIAATVEAAIFKAILGFLAGGTSTGGTSIDAGAGATPGSAAQIGTPGPISFGPESMNHSISNITQIIQQGGGGMNISPSVTVHPIISNQGLAVQVQVGRQQRRKRTM